MARTNIVDSSFNPANLQPAGQPTRQPYGPATSDPLQQEYVITTPMLGADGKTYIKTQIQGADGSIRDAGYTFKDPQTGQLRSYQNDAVRRPDGNGGMIQTGPDRWTEGDFHKDGFFKTIFGDKKLMSFLAIAGGVGAYAAASGAAGGAGGAALGSGTGATPGVVPGGVSGTAGLGGAGAATTIGSQLGGSDPSVNPINSDANANYSDAATGDYSGGLPPVPPGGPNESWLNQVRDIIANNPNLLTGGIGALLGGIANSGDFTSTQTTTNTIDPAIAAYRDQVLGRLGSFGDPNNVPGFSSGATNTGPTGLQASMMNFGNTPIGLGSTAPGATPMPGSQGFGQQGQVGWATPMPGEPGFGSSGPTMYAGGSPNFDMTGGQPSPTLYAGGTPGFYSGGQTGGPTLFREAEQYSGPTGYAAATNPLAGENNPYLTAMLEAANRDMQNYYNTTIAPKFASGSSFGSSGLAFAEALERDNQAARFANLATDLRFQDHALRSQLLESQAGRQDAASQFGLNFGRGLWQDQEGVRQFDLGHARGLWGDQEQARQFNLGHERGLWQDQETARQNRMQLALAGMNAPGNTTTTTSQTAQGNPWLGALGGFLAGSNLWKT